MISIHNIAKRLVSFLLRGNEDKELYREIYEYGAERTIAKVWNFILIYTIARLLHIEILVVCYCIGFFPFRSILGGAHASTRIRCTIISIICLLASIYLSCILQNLNCLLVLEMLMLCFSVGVDYYYGEEHSRLYLLLLTLGLVAVIMILNGYYQSYLMSLSMLLGVVTQAVSMIVKYKGRGKYEKVII